MSFLRDFVIKDLTEKVKTLKKRLDDLGDVFNVIRKSLTSGKNGKRRSLGLIKALSGQPD